jgi:hypothetical protein
VYGRIFDVEFIFVENILEMCELNPVLAEFGPQLLLLRVRKPHLSRRLQSWNRISPREASIQLTSPYLRSYLTADRSLNASIKAHTGEYSRFPKP